jgi:TetR/AcrR family transcriptional regulator, fatty acid biosynthesis regulator
MTTSPARRRLTPELRREMILDEAAQLILDEGVSGVSMERLGREAGISKGLVYAYFPSRNDLLSALLLREHRRFQTKARDLLRVTTSAWLDHIVEHGSLIERLTNEPEIAKIIEDVDTHDRQFTARHFGLEIAHRYGLELDQSVILADLLMGLTGAAGNHVHRTGSDRDDIRDLVVNMIFATLASFAQDAPNRTR